MSNVKAVCAAAVLATVAFVPPASAQCYRSFPSFTSGPDGKAPGGLGSEATNPACEESARKYHNSFGVGAVQNLGTASVSSKQGQALRNPN